MNRWSQTIIIRVIITIIIIAQAKDGVESEEDGETAEPTSLGSEGDEALETCNDDYGDDDGNNANHELIVIAGDLLQGFDVNEDQNHSDLLMGTTPAHATMNDPTDDSNMFGDDIFADMSPANNRGEASMRIVGNDVTDVMFDDLGGLFGGEAVVIVNVVVMSIFNLYVCLAFNINLYHSLFIIFA